MSNITNFNEITVIILAGGKGERIGQRNKGLLQLDSSKLIQICLDKLQKIHTHLLISANDDLEQYKKFNIPVVSDKNKDYQGPLAGLLSCWPSVKTKYTMVIPVDSPLFPEDYTSKMQQAYLEHGGICVANDGERDQYLFLFFETSLFNDMKRFYDGGERSVKHWLKRHKVTRVDYSSARNAFFNINTPDDLKTAKTLC